MTSARFVDRRSAGQELAELLRGLDLDDPVVMGVPHGGVIVAGAVAAALDAPLDVLGLHQVTGHRHDLAIGTVSSAGDDDLREAVAAALGVSPDELRAEADRQRWRLRHLMSAVRELRPELDVAGRTAVVVDDGLVSTAVPALAAERLRQRAAGRRVLAVPVAAPFLATSLADVFDDVVTVEVAGPRCDPADWYRDYHRVTPGEVLDMVAPTRSGTSSLP